MARLPLLAMACGLLSACALIGYDEAPLALSSDGTGGVPVASGGTTLGSGGTTPGSGGTTTAGGAGGTTPDSGGVTTRTTGGQGDGGALVTGGDDQLPASCVSGEQDCVGDLFRQCVDGQWQVTACAEGVSDCRVGVCEAASGCTAVSATDGTDCGSGSCLDGGTCVGGTCQGGVVKDCSALNTACTAGRCDPESGACEAVPVNSGVACGTELVCSGGECIPGTWLCEIGETCNQLCPGDNCVLDCRGSTRCRLDCEGSSCLELCQGVGECILDCVDSPSCVQSCSPTGVCSGSCDTSEICDFNCDGGLDCGPFRCTDSDCTVHCAAAQSCEVKCLGSASCLLQCGEVPGDTCEFTDCDAGPDAVRDCGGGNFVCNRDCP